MKQEEEERKYLEIAALVLRKIVQFSMKQQ